MNRLLDVVVDARCVQDLGLRDRGIGRHAAALLRHARDIVGEEYDLRLLAVVDDALPPLPEDVAALFDDVRANAYTGALDRPGWFVEPSPMTHDPLFVARLVDHPQILTAAVFHDFGADAELERELPGAAVRVDHAVTKYWLSRFDLFLPTSCGSARELHARLKVPAAQVIVTGAAVDADPEAPTGRDVGCLAWRAIMARAEADARRPSATSLYRARRPKMAVLTPLPPDRTGIAHFSAPFLAELGKHVDLHVFTETRCAVPIPAAASVNPLAALPSASAHFDRILGVMGNSHFHTGIFAALTRYGGACVEHDPHLLGFYWGTFGEERLRRTAERELRRPLRDGEIASWLADESRLEPLLLAELAEACEPMFFHSRETVRLAVARYGRPAVHLPFAVCREWSRDQLDSQARRRARARLGIEPGEIAIATFGLVHGTKAPRTTIAAIELLRTRNIPVKLYLVGAVLDDPAPLADFCREIGVEPHIRLLDRFIGEACYRDYLLAADLGIQLRTHGLGGVSGALQDCIAAGLPSVANDNLCEAIEAPGYIRRVPDNPSPALIADAIAEMIDAGQHAHRPHDDREDYFREHNFRVYTRRVLQAQGIALTDAVEP